MAREVSHSIEINANPDHVWSILTDTASLPMGFRQMNEALKARVEASQAAQM